MRLLSCFAILFLFLNRQVAAQQVTDSANQKAKPAAFAPYRFPAFVQGMVFLRNKDTVSIFLNYNVIRNEMQFINELGDTLKLKDPLTVTKIFINGEAFYYNKEKWVQEIETKAGIVLGYWTKVLVELKLNKPDFVDYDQHERRVWMEGNSNFVVHAKDLYFFGDAYGNFIKATRGNLLAYFEKQVPLIKRYLAVHPADFNKLSDIRQVLQFCDTLN